MKGNLRGLVVVEPVLVGVVGDVDDGLDVGEGLRRVETCVTVPCEVLWGGDLVGEQL